MNRSPTSALVLAFVASLLAGCGSIDEEQQPAEFPQPIGYDQAMEAHPGQGQTAVMSTPVEQPTPGPSLAPGEVPGSTTEAQAAAGIAQGQGDIEVGADGSAYADTDPSALTDFRQTLDPYGSWVDDSTYGTVWVPSTTVVGNDFAPYVSAGHWTYDDDWTWVSDYDWGWAPFHYGRWVYIGSRGWSWIPGRTYAGAWVSWRYGDDGWGYLGWAPLPPTWYWYGGAAVGLGFYPRAPYVFCGYHDVFRGDVGHHIATGAQVATIGAHTRPYTPATPTVAGSGRTPAHPTVGGPPPSSIGLAKSEIMRPPPGERGVLHAQQFARPTGAQQLGGHAPSQFSAGNRIASNVTSPSAPRSFPGGLPRSFGAAATAPRYNGIAPTPYRAPSYGAYGSYARQPTYGTRSFGGGSGNYGSYGSYGARPPSYGPQRSFGGGYSPPHYGSFGASPSYSQHAYGSFGSMPHYGGSMPHYGVPQSSGSHPGYSGESAPAPHPSSGGFHGGGGFRGGSIGHAGGGRR